MLLCANPQVLPLKLTSILRRTTSYRQTNATDQCESTLACNYITPRLPCKAIQRYTVMCSQLVNVSE